MKQIYAGRMLAVLCLVSLVLWSTPAAAGRRPMKLQVQSQRIALRQSRVDSGVTLTRARTQMYRAQAVANVTGLFTPFGLIANIIGRSQGF